MNSYDDSLKNEYYEKYLKLKDEFETYRNFAETTIQIISDRNFKLEKKLDAVTNIVEISKYINSYISDKNLITMINDMSIGVLGATYSSIYSMENDKLVVKATNVKEDNNVFLHKDYWRELLSGEPFIINAKEPLFDEDSARKDIHSVIGVPIALREKFIGYMIVEHTLYNFFGHDHINFITTIANQIAIALENNVLYNQIRECAIRDPLLTIYNRKHFFELVEKKIKENPNNKFAIIMVDLDDFKKTNDVNGHLFGDEVLKQTTKIIQDNIDKNDMIGRYGGEEIIIYINELDNIDEVYDKINNIRLKISKNIIYCGNTKSSVTASFGISYYPVNGHNLHEVISIADIRLYEAKKEGKNKIIYR
ncbi:sensor domain-containing diguanylate cyclase [Clostridium aestuarii]|uniref:Sensor domain-containing diguanylate cyclase n=1 Tax=Clostridium aestuarii TaxID=338193 RepID=A0ABT4CW37_9CLOT|nr:sensor domain-containing diguanylate cyclase [Clostridium aestuarii]MCY6483214.1 sensor domain-containing diguanylate cyclase [Clostridium aestuarii]